MCCHFVRPCVVYAVCVVATSVVDIVDIGIRVTCVLAFAVVAFVVGCNTVAGVSVYDIYH